MLLIIIYQFSLLLLLLLLLSVVSSILYRLTWSKFDLDSNITENEHVSFREIFKRLAKYVIL